MKRLHYVFLLDQTMNCDVFSAESKMQNSRLIHSAREGDVDQVRYWIAKGADALSDAMGEAAYFGQSDVVELLMNDFDVSVDFALLAVASSTQFDRSQIVLKQAGHLDDKSLSSLATRHANIARLCVQKTTRLNFAINVAMTSGNAAVVAALTT